ARSVSGSVCSPSAVEPVTSQKRTVTTLRTSRGAVADWSGAPHCGQNREAASVSCPQLVQVGTYGSLSRSDQKVDGLARRVPNRVPKRANRRQLKRSQKHSTEPTAPER